MSHATSANPSPETSAKSLAELGDTVLNVMSDGVVVADLRGQLLYLNRAARSALAMDEVALQVPVETSLSRYPNLVQLLSGGGVSTDAGHRLEVCENGVSRSYEMRRTELLGPKGALESRMIVLNDVTEREHADEQRRLSEISLRHVIDLFPHRIYVRDREGKFLMANAVTAANYGVETEELLGQTIFDVEDSSAVAEKLLAEDRMVIASGEKHRSRVTERGARGRETVFDSTKTPFRFPATGEPAVLGVAVDVTAQIRAEERVRALAFYDTLTGLPNRRRFRRLLSRTLEASRRQKKRFALLFVNLDRFKEVNNRLGHQIGDQLLREVGERLRESLRVTDELSYPDKSDSSDGLNEGEGSIRNAGHSTLDSQPLRDGTSKGEGDDGADEPIARLAGDEFTVLLPEVGEPANAAQVADRVIAGMSQPFCVDGHEVFITATVGIALYPDDGLSTGALLHCADQAMDEAKRSGPNCYAFFDASMNAVAARRLEIQVRLRHAIEAGELRVVYQQIRSAATGRICGSEALLRWDSAELGSVGPDEFIPIAEGSGLIADIGRWVLAEACRQQALWRQQGLLPPRVAINVSAAQLQLPGFAEDARSIVLNAGLDPDEVEFELTETAILRQDEQTDQTLRELAEMGVRLSLDDFGTGQSSLSYLRRFPFSRIKIDRSFISEIPKNVDDANLTHAIIAMAHGLNLSVVAEGVETEEQVAFLREHGCDELQGFLLAKPQSPAEFATYLERTKPERTEPERSEPD